METNLPGAYHFSSKRFYEKTWFKVSLGVLIGGGIALACLQGCSNKKTDKVDFKNSSEYAEMSGKIIALQDSVDVYADSLWIAQNDLAIARDSLANCHKRCPVVKNPAKKTTAPAKKVAKKPAAPAKKTVQTPVVHDTVFVAVKPAAADVSVSGDNNNVVVGNNNTVIVKQDNTPTDSVKTVVVDHTIVKTDVVVYSWHRGRRR